MRQTTCIIVLTGLLGLSLPSMAGQPQPPPSPVPGPAVITMASAATTNTAARAGIVVVDDEHALAPGDRVSIQIIEDREPPKPLVVTDAGELDVPYLGRVSVAGKTCQEVAGQLKVMLEKDYYYRATVMVGLDQVNRIAGKVYVWGQVRTQGAIEIPVNENFTAGKAILRAGGFADFANKKKVKLVRSGKPGSTDKQTFELNMVDILEDGKTEEDIVLQSDDFIIVPARLVNW
jgi:protein involved in polysaccharide export with SLBB domain